MVEVYSRTPAPARNFNRDLLRREIREQFPAKFVELDVGGYEPDLTLFTTGSSIEGRIFKPRAAAVIITSDQGGDDIYQPGELRTWFDPALSAGQETTFDQLLVDHDETDTTPRQNAADVDIATLADITAFDLGAAWNTRTNPEQNQHIDDINRMVLRIWNLLDPGV